jgi:hypothetical protein
MFVSIAGLGLERGGFLQWSPLLAFTLRRPLRGVFFMPMRISRLGKRTI